MISGMILDKLTEADRLNVETALMTLAASGVLSAEVQRRELEALHRLNTTNAHVFSMELATLRAECSLIRHLETQGKQLITSKGVR